MTEVEEGGGKLRDSGIGRKEWRRRRKADKVCLGERARLYDSSVISEV